MVETQVVSRNIMASIDISQPTLLAVVAFILIWYFFGLLAAIVIGLVVLLLTGTIKVR
jgi:hypothetical protein